LIHFYKRPPVISNRHMLKSILIKIVKPKSERSCDPRNL